MIAAAVLALIQAVLPAVTAASTIAKIIDTLIQLFPLIVQEVKDLAPIVKNVIATLRGNGAVTSDQLDKLDEIEAKIDAEFETAAAAATAEDAEAAAKSV